ncbi:SPOR domain-containing protein [Sulfurovum sp.]|jgi:FtsZ-interacting cell division protein ZipA|uniref:SPOR domain-containing protein n=1 Tax=Sulfurovum sp. TaxID=1969726 RepID=UPI002A362054|nr:SPOR domain-containing protein [Sulfurovum sp.]MDY0403219.1 SPOR domain-containing protein [Sulfurovum sp.]
MNDHNLDDLIIDDIQPNQSNKTKSFLTIIALAIVVLIVSIIFTKMLLKAPKQDELLFEQNETEIISPDLTLQSVTEPEDETSEPLASSKEEDLLDISKETVSQKVTEEVPAPVTKETTVISETPQQSISQELEVETEKEPEPARMPKTEEEKPTDILDIAEESAVTRTEPHTPKKSYQKTTPKHIEKTVQQTRTKPANPITRPQSQNSKGIQTGGYYIQVGAFSTVPSRRFLESISQNGFTYTITKKSPSGLRKLLIGPYPDRKSAERALVKVKDRINKRAFLLK